MLALGGRREDSVLALRAWLDPCVAVQRSAAQSADVTTGWRAYIILARRRAWRQAGGLLALVQATTALEALAGGRASHEGHTKGWRCSSISARCSLAQGGGREAPLAAHGCAVFTLTSYVALRLRQCYALSTFRNQIVAPIITSTEPTASGSAASEACAPAMSC